MLSKAKHLIQILRRSAPQNDKTGRTAIRTTRWNQTIHCSQTPRQTGICNWRQRGVENGNGCSDCSRVCQLQVQAEFIKAGFSRASRSPALRRLAKLAPLASARKQQQRRPKQSLRTKQRALFLNKANAACGVRPAKAEAASRRMTKNGGRTTVRKQLFLINPPAPLRRQRTAESADLAGGSRGLRHSGPWNCFCRKRKTKIVCRKNSNA